MCSAQPVRAFASLPVHFLAAVPAFVAWQCPAGAKVHALKARCNKAWCDGYRFATAKGKPIAAAAAKPR
jgi:hypothetical protein